jgi:hypothetical protein
MTSMEFCEICHEDYPVADVSKVNCGSVKDHLLCHHCEGEWRSKMPLQDNGMRVMNCPTCRAPEQYRTVESLQREVVRLNRLLASDIEIITEAEFLDEMFEGLGLNGELNTEIDFEFTLPSSVTVRPPRRIACASGRGNCRSRSQSGVTFTTRKCGSCNVVPCCRNCVSCVGCVPIPVQ